jgi:tetratricopeptide (TPR) repeat protein
MGGGLNASPLCVKGVNMKKFIFVILAIFFVLFVFQLDVNLNAQSNIPTLAKSKYSDPNNYFKIVPPDGWQIQQYSQDTRGKVAFIGPNGVELRVLVKGLDYNTFEKMLEDIKGIEKQLGTNTNIQKIIFSDYQAVRRTFTSQGVKILFIDFMVHNIEHNLMYSATPEQYEKYLPLAQASIDTYEPNLDSVSQEDVKKHIISKSLRLSQVFFEQGNYDLALEFINEGLNVEPNNSNLLELKNRILAFQDTTKSLTIKDKQDNSDEETGPGLFMILSIVGSLILIFQKEIANGTAAPGLARIFAPLIGIVLIFYGVVEGLFGKGYVFLGIITILIVLIIIASRIIYLIKKEKKGIK